MVLWKILKIFTVSFIVQNMPKSTCYTNLAPGDEMIPASDDEYLIHDLPEEEGNPVITTQPQEIIPQLGGHLVLPCNVENYDPEYIAVVWRLNETTLFIDSHPISKYINYLYTVDPNYSLEIKNFSVELYGNYTCEIPDFQLSIIHTVMPKETVAVESISAKQFVENLSELRLICHTKGFPTPTISWFRKSSENLVEMDLNSKSATYVIPRATFGDSGIYSCKADNGESSDVKSVTITVINKNQIQGYNAEKNIASSIDNPEPESETPPPQSENPSSINSQSSPFTENISPPNGQIEIPISYPSTDVINTESPKSPSETTTVPPNTPTNELTDHKQTTTLEIEILDRSQAIEASESNILFHSAIIVAVLLVFVGFYILMKRTVQKLSRENETKVESVEGIYLSRI